MAMRAKQCGLLGGLLLLPWCCIVPAGVSILGAAGVAAARAMTGGFVPFFLPVGLFLLGRAHYLIYVKEEGNRVSRLMTWTATFVAIFMWVLPWAG